MKYRVLFPAQIEGAQSTVARVSADCARRALSGADVDGFYVVVTRYPFEGTAPATDLFDTEEQAIRAIAGVRLRVAYQAPEVNGHLAARLDQAVIHEVREAGGSDVAD